MLVYHSNHWILPHSSDTLLHGTMRLQRREAWERRRAVAARTSAPLAFREQAPVSSGQFIERGCVLSRRLLAGGGQLGCILFELAPVLLFRVLIQGGDRRVCKHRSRHGQGQNDVCHDNFPVVAHRRTSGKSDATPGAELEISWRFP